MGFSTGSPPHGVRTPKSRLTGTARFTIHLILQRKIRHKHIFTEHHTLTAISILLSVSTTYLAAKRDPS